MISGLLSKLRTNIFGKSSGNAGFGSSGFTETDNINLTKSPVSSLDSDPLRFGTYQFPKDVFENQQLGHYMVFYINQQDRQKYDYGDSKLNIDLTGVDLGFRSALALDTGLPAHRNRLKIKRNELTGGSYDSNDDLLSATDYNRNSSAMQQLGKARKTTKRITDSIALYLPGQVTDTTGVTYEDLPTGLVGKVLGDAAGLVKSYNQDDFEKVGQQAAAGLKAFVTEAGRRLLATAAEGLLGAEGAVQGVNKLFGQADNPFVEVLFSGVNIRTFTYNFEFAPRNEVETDEIQQIIQLFRFHMVPELQSQNGRYLTLPSTFDIHYMYQLDQDNANENNFYSKIATCVLQTCDVDYTPGGVKSFHDGAPTQITMGLTFMETELITKDKVNQGF